MTREEFARVIAYIATATDKELATKRLEVYFELLGDLPFEVLLSAAKRVVLEHPWPNFPSIAELRSAAVLSLQGSAASVSPVEAWEMARKFGAKFDPEQRGEYMVNGKVYKSQFDYLVHNLPPIVVKAIAAFGPLSLSVGSEPTGVLRAQFIDTFEQLAKSEERVALLPAPVKDAIERGPAKRLSAKVALAIEGIGKPME